MEANFNYAFYAHKENFAGCVNAAVLLFENFFLWEIDSLNGYDCLMFKIRIFNYTKKRNRQQRSLFV